MSKTTQHGEAIAEQIQGEDAYGYSGDLTVADLWLILDNLQTHFIRLEIKDGISYLNDNNIVNLLSNWMETLEDLDEDLPL